MNLRLILILSHSCNRGLGWVYEFNGVQVIGLGACVSDLLAFLGVGVLHIDIEKNAAIKMVCPVDNSG